MIQALIFDCFGVLTVDIWRAFCDSLPDTVDLKAVRDLNHAYDSGFISEHDFINGVTELTGKKPPDINAAELGKNQLLLKLISTLKPQYKTAIMSNISNDWITRELLTPQEQLLFDEMIFSYEVNMIKPDPRIYELACSRLSVEPESVILVDDIERNVTAALELGMQGIVYRNFNDFQKEITSLLNPQP